MAGSSKNLYATKLPGMLWSIAEFMLKKQNKPETNTKEAYFVRIQSKQEHTPKELQHLCCQLRNEAWTATERREALLSGFLSRLSEVNGTPLAPVITACYEGCKM